MFPSHRFHLRQGFASLSSALWAALTEPPSPVQTSWLPRAPHAPKKEKLMDREDLKQLALDLAQDLQVVCHREPDPSAVDELLRLAANASSFGSG